MPDPVPFDVVVSLAGHDRGKLFVVVGRDGDRLLLCDGRNRRLRNPKTKSPKHVRLAARGSQEPGSDKVIRTTLAQAATEAAAKEGNRFGER